MSTVFSIDPALDKSVTIDVPGWKKNLIIIYSVEIHAGVSYLCWKIKDTEHLFRIHATVVYEKHGIKFQDHFILTLKTFVEDYKAWEKQEFSEEWMKRYYRIYNHLII